MPAKPKTTLAIDPGTREIGVAVLCDLELLYFGVKSIRWRQSPQSVLGEANKIVIDLIEKYQPAVLAIEKTFMIHKSAALLNVVADEIKATARQHDLIVREYTPTDVRKRICQTGKATKRRAAEVVVSRYPELARFFHQRTKWEELYYANMFDAVAVGLAFLDDVEH